MLNQVLPNKLVVKLYTLKISLGVYIFYSMNAAKDLDLTDNSPSHRLWILHLIADIHN